MRKQRLREDLDALWGMLPTKEVKELKKHEPELVSRVIKNHQKLWHKSSNIIQRIKFFFNTNGQGY